MEDRNLRAQLIEKVRARSQRVAELEEEITQLEKELVAQLATEDQIVEMIPKSGFRLERAQQSLGRSHTNS